MALLKMILIFLSLGVYFCSAQKKNSTMPASVPSVVIRGTGSETCPAQEAIEEQRNSTKSNIIRILNSRYYQSPCACGGSGEWSRIAYLDMTDSTQQCPLSWRLYISPVRGCGRYVSRSCSSAIFPANGRTYSHVCGKVIAYQRGSTDAFSNSIFVQRNPNDVYIDGVSLTHGVSGSRQHIWSFASALYEQDPNYQTRWTCPCTNTNYNWTHSTPSFVGNDYFCDTGNSGPGFRNGVYPDDPLWDGQGCGPASTCCEFNNPPWFCKTLPQPTSDDIELRICGSDVVGREDVFISLVDINVQ